jgi:hypothetical protein
MSRKDYVIIAAALARTRPDDDLARFRTGFGTNGRQWLVTRDAIMGALQADNANFDRPRFIRATEAD